MRPLQCAHILRGGMSKRTLIAVSVTGAAILAGALIGASLLMSGGRAPANQLSLAGAGITRALLEGIPQQGNELGRPTAPVTLVEYADLQCPYCARFAVQDLPLLVREYVRGGRVRIVFRGLAFVGPDSETALRTVLAAGDQGRLWQVTELLYHNQGPENSGWVTEDLLRRVGESVPGLSVGRMLNGRYGTSVEEARSAAVAAAQRDGVTGTPFFSVGRTGDDMQPLASNDPRAIRGAIDALLAR